MDVSACGRPRCRPARVVDIIRALVPIAPAERILARQRPKSQPGYRQEPPTTVESAMATCPECDAEIEVDEFDVDKGDELSCPECGSNLEVTSVSPLELDLAPDDDEDDDEDDDMDDDDLEGDEEDDEDGESDDDEGWDE